MSDFKKDIEGFLESEIQFKAYKATSIVKCEVCSGLEYLLGGKEFTGVLELVEKFNLRYDVVDKTYNDSGYEDHVLKFDRPDKREESVFIKITYNSYSGERWRFVTPKPFEGVIYE